MNYAWLRERQTPQKENRSSGCVGCLSYRLMWRSVEDDHVHDDATRKMNIQAWFHGLVAYQQWLDHRWQLQWHSQIESNHSSITHLLYGLRTGLANRFDEYPNRLSAGNRWSQREFREPLQKEKKTMTCNLSRSNEPRINGISPSSFLQFTLAPYFTSAWTTSRWPPWAAACSAV